MKETYYTWEQVKQASNGKVFSYGCYRFVVVKSMRTTVVLFKNSGGWEAADEHSWEHIDSFTATDEIFNAEIEAAPFKPIIVCLSSDYSATISRACVEVGCQRLSFEKIEEVYAAVQKAKEFNASH